MESEFDKEIDILMRQAARRGDLASETAAASHLDADEINAFAEHLLSGKAQARAVEHLADCSRCRNILSNLIVLNAEPESEIVHAAEGKNLLMPPGIPWYKKLFAFPQIAYAMGTLALIFGGIIAVIVLKTSTQHNSSEVARMDERESSSASATPAAPSVISSMSANSSQANISNSAVSTTSSANANVSSATPRPENKAGQTANSSMSNAASIPEKSGGAAKLATPKAAAPANEAEAKKEKAGNMMAAPPPVASAILKQDVYMQDGALNSAPQSQTEPSQNQAQNETRMTPDTKSVQNLPLNGRNTMLKTARRAEATGGAAAKDEKAEDKPAATKNIGGKSFRRADGVWYDVNYKGQKTVNISRNSDDYKKLDANLRSVADNLGGVVVILSGGKAYRIQ